MRNINQLPPLRAQTEDQTCNPGMCPDWKSNLQLFGYTMILQPTEPHRPGSYLLFFFFFLCFLNFFNVYFFIVYVVTAPNFFSLSLSPLSPTHYSPSVNPHNVAHVRGPCIYVLWLIPSLSFILFTTPTLQQLSIFSCYS